MSKPTKKQLEKIAARYERIIEQVSSDMGNGRHVAAAIGSAGITFSDDWRGFVQYCEKVKAIHIVDALVEMRGRAYWGLPVAELDKPTVDVDDFIITEDGELPWVVLAGEAELSACCGAEISSIHFCKDCKENA